MKQNSGRRDYTGLSINFNFSFAEIKSINHDGTSVFAQDKHALRLNHPNWSKINRYTFTFMHLADSIIQSVL